MNELPKTLTIKIGPDAGIVQNEVALSLVPSFHEALRTPCQPVDINQRMENHTLADCMMKICRTHGGFGLSANQLGISKRLFVLDVPSGTPIDWAYYNPEIIEYSEGFEKMEEGCLSFPMVEAMISRPLWVILGWQTIYGERKRGTFHGMTARVVCHEMDHLNGLTIFDHMGPVAANLAASKAQKKLKKFERLKKRQS
jgi:peptide deformylase